MGFVRTMLQVGATHHWRLRLTTQLQLAACAVLISIGFMFNFATFLRYPERTFAKFGVGLGTAGAVAAM
jgi:hypothetical protein